MYFYSGCCFAWRSSRPPSGLRESKAWDVIFDARGTFIEPHTSREVPLGTLEVRQYLGERPYFGLNIDIVSRNAYPTVGPENRYPSVLSIEKEGFNPLLLAPRIAERFDIAIMSTKECPSRQHSGPLPKKPTFKNERGRRYWL